MSGARCWQRSAATASTARCTVSPPRSWRRWWRTEPLCACPRGEPYILILQQDRLQNTVGGRFSLAFVSCDFQNKERAAGFSHGFEALMPDSFTGRRCELLQDPAPCGHKKHPGGVRLFPLYHREPRNAREKCGFATISLCFYILTAKFAEILTFQHIDTPPPAA